MTTAVPSTALATIQPAFTDPERLALAGFPAGYRGLTREAYALDLRQFTSWCRTRSLALFAVSRADIESLARELEARGRARATVNRPAAVRGNVTGRIAYAGFWPALACRRPWEGCFWHGHAEVAGHGTVPNVRKHGRVCSYELGRASGSEGPGPDLRRACDWPAGPLGARQ